MTKQTPPKLDYLIAQNQQHLLIGGFIGLEKESLRVSNNGKISQKPHPHSLGSALTHPHITTDYSEALLEFITPAFADVRKTLEFMETIHQYVYHHLDDEMLLAASMPCGIDGDDSIPIAEYGASNIGTMKNVYRQGLWHRYGRTMQAIAGIHFNYSIPTQLWPELHKYSNSSLHLDDYISESYFDLIRNFQRQGWLILYLFGASPAICKSFFKSRPHLMDEFEEFDRYTLYHPYATSLRMSDIGYKSKNQANLYIDLNSLSSYVESLHQAIETPYPEYEKIGIKKDGQYQQLNANILQIENEYYSTMRPKQIAKSGEKPTLALKRRGVAYVEMRSLDLDLFNPIGIDETKARFIEAFLINCLLHDSPKYQGIEYSNNNMNQLNVAHCGRKPGLKLNRNGKQILLKSWAEEIVQSMEPVCHILDSNHPDKPYTKALEIQMAAIENPDLTVSAKLLNGMRSNESPFGGYGLTMSRLHQTYFLKNQLDKNTMDQFDQISQDSHQNQIEIESGDTLSFDQYLANYFSQH